MSGATQDNKMIGKKLSQIYKTMNTFRVVERCIIDVAHYFPLFDRGLREDTRV